MTWDVVVVGGGNAALCAALAARERGARVLLLEKAPEGQRGGNSFFTAGGFRFAHQGLEDLRRDILDDLSDEEAAQVEVPPYPADTFYDDVMRLSEGLSDADLVDVLVRRSRATVAWMRGQGLRFILMLGRQSFKVGNVHRLWGGLNVEAVGGGPGLVQAEYDRAAAGGVEVRYGTKAVRLHLDDRGAVRGHPRQGSGRIPRPGGPGRGPGLGRFRGQPRVAHAVPRSGLGAGPGARHAATTPATASAWPWRSEPSPTATGRAATRWPGRQRPALRRPAGWGTCSRSTPTPWG